MVIGSNNLVGLKRFPLKISLKRIRLIKERGQILVGKTWPKGGVPNWVEKALIKNPYLGKGLELQRKGGLSYQLLTFCLQFGWIISPRFGKVWTFLGGFPMGLVGSNWLGIGCGLPRAII